jgi:hypothetical protein
MHGWKFISQGAEKAGCGGSGIAQKSESFSSHGKVTVAKFFHPFHILGFSFSYVWDLEPSNSFSVCLSVDWT